MLKSLALRINRRQMQRVYEGVWRTAGTFTIYWLLLRGLQNLVIDYKTVVYQLKGRQEIGLVIPRFGRSRVTTDFKLSFTSPSVEELASSSEGRVTSLTSPVTYLYPNYTHFVTLPVEGQLIQRNYERRGLQPISYNVDTPLYTRLWTLFRDEKASDSKCG